MYFTNVCSNGEVRDLMGSHAPSYIPKVSELKVSFFSSVLGLVRSQKHVFMGFCGLLQAFVALECSHGMERRVNVGRKGSRRSARSLCTSPYRLFIPRFIWKDTSIKCFTRDEYECMHACVCIHTCAQYAYAHICVCVFGWLVYDSKKITFYITGCSCW